MKSKFIVGLFLMSGFLLTGPVFGGGEQQEQKKGVPVEEPLWTAQGYDYNKLVEAAKQEGSLTVRWHSGRAPDSAKKFEETYGIKVTATPRFDDSENIERLRREVEANNVQVDVVGIDDGATLINDLIPNGVLTSWTPPDLAAGIGAESKNPQIYLWQPVIFGYNSAVYPNKAPISNLWELTEEKWKGKVVICDPQIQPYMWHFFAGVIEQADLFAQAYQAYYGRPLVTQEENAGWEWVLRMFKNGMITVQHDTDISKAIGSPGQSDPPVGFFTLTRFRDAQEQNLSLGFDPNVKPYAGFALPTFVAIPVKAPHPNAARLWTRWVLTQEGHQPWSGVIGGFSPNSAVPAAPNPLGTWDKWVEKLLIIDEVKSSQVRQDLQDLFMINR
ncbi:MAG: ABC transporter substrate-binding protein [Treponema sp.]|jgi:iron(III) transport system substrate-binding protein|nr:ABC transporter substrate-binding protein [Treponema sp.]